MLVTSGCARSGFDPKAVIRGEQSVLNSCQQVEFEAFSSLSVEDVINGVGPCTHLKMIF